MQQGNYINVFLARHVLGTYAHHQEHWMLSCSIWFSAPSFWMGGGLPEGKRPLGRHRRRWVDNIRMDLQEVRCGYMDWIGLAQDRDRWWTLVCAVMNLQVP